MPKKDNSNDLFNEGKRLRNAYIKELNKATSTEEIGIISAKHNAIIETAHVDETALKKKSLTIVQKNEIHQADATIQSTIDELNLFFAEKAIRTNHLANLKKASNFVEMNSTHKKYSNNGNKSAALNALTSKLTPEHLATIKTLDTDISSLLESRTDQFYTPVTNNNNNVVEHTIVENKKPKESKNEKAGSAPSQPLPQVPNYYRVLKLEDVYAKIAEFRQKEKGFSDLYTAHPTEMKYKDAADAVERIVADIESATKRFVCSQIDLPTYQQEVKKLQLDRKDDIATLKTHRGVKELLTNLFAGIAMLGVGYLLAAAIKGRWTVFKPATDASNKFDELENAVAHVKPT